MQKIKNGISINKIKINKKIFRKTNFVLSANSISQLPSSNLPEIAFLGRSNVGKSSLINAITGIKSLARTSSTPGRTQQINFFNVENLLMIADLPGYGYVSGVSRKLVKNWTSLVKEYLMYRSQLRRILLLIDSRRGLMKSDYSVINDLETAAVSYQIILTKSDKMKGIELNNTLEDTKKIIKRYTACNPEIFITSIKEKNTIKKFRKSILFL